MKKILLIIMILYAIGISQLAAQEYPIDLEKAHQYFMEAKELADKDNSRLWGINMYGPMLFVDPSTRFVVTNEADLLGKLKKEKNVFIGKLSEQDGIANTSTEWAGKRWMMILWPSLSNNNLERTNLMMHELYHCVQKKIGMEMKSEMNNHLDEMQARIWLTMEWNALEKAVFSKGKEREQSIYDALIFRNYRHKIYPGSKENECNLEMNEGIAEYTGFKLSYLNPEDQQNYFRNRLKSGKMTESYVRSFAYLSGPMYGYLLDESRFKWKQKLKNEGDLGNLLQSAYSIKLDTLNLNQIAENRSLAYNYNTVYGMEKMREDDRLNEVNELTTKLVERPILIIDFVNMNYQFNPNNLKSLDNYGTVFPTIRVNDDWGILEVNGGSALMNKARTAISISAQKIKIKGKLIEGEEWTLELDTAWMLVTGARDGDFLVKKIEDDITTEADLKTSYKQSFTESPVLICPIDESLNYSFAPNSTINMEEFGTVYKAPINIIAAWGNLKLTKGVTLINKERSHFLISLPISELDRKLSGDGWVLYLNEGWKIDLCGGGNKILVPVKKQECK